MVLSLAVLEPFLVGLLAVLSLVGLVLFLVEEVEGQLQEESHIQTMEEAEELELV